VLVPDLQVVVQLSKLLDVVKLFNFLEIDVISDPHIFKCLKEETLFQLPLGEESHEVLLLEVESQKRYDQCTFFGFLDTSASHFNKLQALLQLYVFVPVVDNLIEIFNLCVRVDS
jgi:hypothetical protein